MTEEMVAQQFDYSALDVETRIVVQQRTGEIKALMRKTAQDVVEIGQKLIEVKERLGHGYFGEWLAGEFEWSESTAQRFIRVTERFKSVNLTDLTIAPSALYLLAAPSTPEEAREAVLERARSGEPITYSKAREAVAPPPAPQPFSAGCDTCGVPMRVVKENTFGDGQVNIVAECPRCEVAYVYWRDGGGRGTVFQRGARMRYPLTRCVDCEHLGDARRTSGVEPCKEVRGYCDQEAAWVRLHSDYAECDLLKPKSQIQGAQVARMDSADDLDITDARQGAASVLGMVAAAAAQPPRTVEEIELEGERPPAYDGAEDMSPHADAVLRQIEVAAQNVEPARRKTGRCPVCLKTPFAYFANEDGLGWRCGDCGAQVDLAQVAPFPAGQTALVSCSACGAPMAAGSDFCRKCGEVVDG